MNKRTLILVLACLLCIAGMKAGDYETLRAKKIKNPMLWADVPDPDVIRVGDTFYIPEFGIRTALSSIHHKATASCHQHYCR